MKFPASVCLFVCSVLLLLLFVLFYLLFFVKTFVRCRFLTVSTHARLMWHTLFGACSYGLFWQNRIA